MAELVGRKIFIEQFDESRPHMYQLDSYRPQESDPLRILYDRLPKQGTLSEYTELVKKYGITVLHDVYFEEATPAEL